MWESVDDNPVFRDLALTYHSSAAVIMIRVSPMPRQKGLAIRFEAQGLILLVAIFFTLLLVGKTQEPRTSRVIDAPLWKLDVRSLGYTPWNVRESGETPVTLSQVSFISDAELAITFVSHIVPEALPRRSEPESANLRLNALFIDSKSGRVRGRNEWPTTSERSRITPAGRGGFLVVTPDKLILTSSGIQPDKELGLPIGREALQGWWDAVPSPKGKYLMIWYDAGPQGSIRKWELVDVDNLLIARAFTEPHLGMSPRAPFDDGTVLATDWEGTVVARLGDVIGAPPDGPWRPDKAPWGACRPDRGVTLIDDQTILGTGDIMFPQHRWCHTLAQTNGELIFRQEFPEKEQIELDAGLGGVAVSAGGERFAVAVYKTRGGSILLDIGSGRSIDRIMLYDLTVRRWTYTLDAKKHGLKSLSGVALSPDGSLLALIDQQGTLQLYGVP